MQTDVDPRVRRTTQFNLDAAELIIETGREAIARNGLFRIGLAGGNTPRAVYEQLSAHSDALPWDRVQITFGDERCVPPEDANSNYRMAKESLLSRVPIPEGNVFRIKGELSPEVAASEYEAKLSAVATRRPYSASGEFTRSPPMYTGGCFRNVAAPGAKPGGRAVPCA